MHSYSLAGEKTDGRTIFRANTKKFSIFCLFSKRLVCKNWLVDIHVYDTKLLAPATHQSLKKLSNLLGPEDEGKEDIPDEYIKNMHQYLWDYPEKYRTYALRDSEVTLKLFFSYYKRALTFWARKRSKSFTKR